MSSWKAVKELMLVIVFVCGFLKKNAKNVEEEKENCLLNTKRKT